MALEQERMIVGMMCEWTQVSDDAMMGIYRCLMMKTGMRIPILECPNLQQEYKVGS